MSILFLNLGGEKILWPGQNDNDYYLVLFVPEKLNLIIFENKLLVKFLIQATLG